MENQWKINEAPPLPSLPPPSPSPSLPTVYCRERSRTEIFAKSGAPRNLRGLWGRSWGKGPKMKNMGPIMGTMGPKLCRRIGNDPRRCRFFSVKSTIDRFY